MPSEQNTLARLGVPADAARVMIVSESTHWDPNWLLTSSEYFRLFVHRTLDLALDELVIEPRRVYSLECVFFPDLYWRMRPDRRELFRQLVNEGRLHFTGCGVTTPDTLLPDEELILRDLLVGQEWLRTRGMNAEPRTLYLPDSFGHSPALPSLLAAAGIDRIAFHRIDGMHFPGGETRNPSEFPRPDSSAAQLTGLGTADFEWRGPDGSIALAHWMSHGYGHGDMIASRGLARVMRLPTSWPDREPSRVAARIRKYVSQLEPLALTPYMLLAIGYDFVPPIPRLVDLLDRWNEREYETSGIWLVNATLDDYFDLISHHRQVLPTIDFDPNPCWTGFYASRPDLKERAGRLFRRLVDLDNTRAAIGLSDPAVLPAVSGPSGSSPAEQRHEERSPSQDPWWIAVSSNHHDFITGTGTERVVRSEQLPLLDRAIGFTELSSTELRSTGGASTELSSIELSSTGGASARSAPIEPYGASHGPPPSWVRQGSTIVVEAGWATATFSSEHGGALVRLVGADGTDLIIGPSLALVSRRDSGGLWRMGCEYPGGRWDVSESTSGHRANLSVSQDPTRGVTTVRSDARLDGRWVCTTTELSSWSQALVVNTTIRPKLRRTVSLNLRIPGQLHHLVMHQPGGAVRRPLERVYEPTFWPLNRWATIAADNGDTDGQSISCTNSRPSGPTEPGGGLARSGSPASNDRLQPEGPLPGRVTVQSLTPTAIHTESDGTVEIVVARSAVKELAHGAIPILAPAWGRGFGSQNASFAIIWPHDGCAPTNSCATKGKSTDRSPLETPPRWAVQSDDPKVEVVAVKVADRGPGVIVRLVNCEARVGSTRHVTLRVADEAGASVEQAWLTDSRERDLDDLAVVGGVVSLDVDRYLTTVRLTTSS